MTSRIYLDYNATAPLLPAARDAMLSVLDGPHNASSVHSFGREARKQLEDARRRVAASVSAFPNEVIFTASGTEANNWALTVFPERWWLASAVEHPSILKNPGVSDTIPVDADGVVNLAELKARLPGPPALVSVMLANNETGVIQPVAEIAALCREYGALLHCDAAQAIGRIPVDFGQLGADMMTITGHKCGGPVGAAALVVKTGFGIPPLLLGGAQESSRRAGTENLAAIMGFAAAAEAANNMQQLEEWMAEMEQELSALGAVIMGEKAKRLPNTSYIAMPGVSNEVQMMDFDLSGIAVSAGSACSSGKIGPSHVLAAMKAPDAAFAIRVSCGWGTKQADIQAFTERWKSLYSRASQAAKTA